ncbi:UNVERIFIED_CONTAM: hypothetical protein FKN15_041750 [Acipenser sinensis]
MALLRQYFWLWLALGIGFVSLILGLLLTLLCWCIFKKGKQQQSFSQQQKSSRDSELYENKETEPAYLDVFDEPDYDDVMTPGFVSEDYDDIENQPPDRGFTK